MQDFISQSMRRMGLAVDNKVTPVSPNTGDQRAANSKAPLSHMEIGSKWSYSTLEYPMDIQQRSDMGHYMMFYINIATDSGYSRYSSTKKASKTGTGRWGNKKSVEVGQKQDPEQLAILSGTEFSEDQAGTTPSETGDSWKPGSKPKVIARKPWQGTAANATGSTRTHRTNDAIVLYMPAQVTTSYAADYKDTDLGANVGEALGRASRADMTSAG